MRKHLRESIYTATDYAIVRSAVKRLPGLLGIVIEMRFWQNRTLAEIAMELGVSVRSVELALPRALIAIREECLRNPVFSRSKFDEIQRFYTQNVA